MAQNQYDSVARTLHWIMAVLILLMMFIGVGLENLTPQMRADPLKMHSGVGLALLLLALFRIWWCRRRPAPPYPRSMSALQQKLTRAGVYAFYFLMVFQPVVGIFYAATHVETTVSPFGLFNLTALAPSNAAFNQIFGLLHGIGFSLLALLVIIHVGATLKHWLIDKDEILSRMTPFVKPPKRD